MHRWINIAEAPFICRKLAIWMDVVSVQHEFELLLGEVRINQNQSQAMKSQVPVGVPGILPLVRHRDNLVIEHMSPVSVADRDVAFGYWKGMVFRQPARDIEMIVLLAPQHASECLAEDALPVLIELGWRDRAVECVSLHPALGEDLVEGSVKSRIIQAAPLQPQSHSCRASGRDIEQVVCGSLGTGLRRVDRGSTAVQQEVVDAVLDKGGSVGGTEDALIVRLVLGEKELR